MLHASSDSGLFSRLMKFNVVILHNGEMSLIWLSLRSKLRSLPRSDKAVRSATCVLARRRIVRSVNDDNGVRSPSGFSPRSTSCRFFMPDSGRRSVIPLNRRINVVTFFRSDNGDTLVMLLP